MAQNFDVKTVSVQMTVAPTTVTTVLDPESYDKGYNAGETEGHKTGKAEGYTEGYDKGKSDGYGEGWDIGEKAGYQSGKSDGYAEGYTKGDNDGYTAGHADGYDEGIEAGKQAEYDAFWDDFQQNGNRTNYYAAFAGMGWSEKTLKPKYKVAPIDESYGTQNAHSLFFHCVRGYHFGKMLDFRKFAHLFDFSKVINPNRLFAEAGIDYITADLSNAEALYETFSEQWGGTRTHITLTVSEKCTNYQLCFANARYLTDLIFTEGSVIAANIDLQASPLTKESITSVVNALSTSTTGKTITFKKSAKEAAFTADEWAALIATKSNWTISLI